METESSDEGPGRIGFHQLGICVSVCASEMRARDEWRARAGVCVRGGGITHKLQIKTKRQRRQLEEESGYSQDTVLSHVGMIHNQNSTSHKLSEDVWHHQAAVNSGLNQGASSQKAWVRMRMDEREEGRQKSK